MMQALRNAQSHFAAERVEATLAAAARTGDTELATEVRAMTRVGVALIDVVLMLRQQRGALDAEIRRLRTENLNAEHAVHT